MIRAMFTASRRIKLRQAILVAGVLLACCITLTAPAMDCLAAEEPHGLPKVLHAGFLARIYHDIDPRDAKAATELLARGISRNMGLTTDPRVTIYDTMDDLITAVRRGELELVSMPTIDYLRIRDSVPLIPAVVGAHNGGRGTSYLLVVRRRGAIKTFGDLKGKNILLMPATKHEASRLWLEMQVARHNSRTLQSFFTTIQESSRVSQSVMAVFFKKADVALVTRAGFETSCQLNPQIGKELAVVAESDYYSDGVTCFPVQVSPKVRSIISTAISNLNMSITGRQLYTIFQTTGTTPFRPEFMDGLEKLISDRNRLMPRTGATRRKS